MRPRRDAHGRSGAAPLLAAAVVLVLGAAGGFVLWGGLDGRRASSQMHTGLDHLPPATASPSRTDSATTSPATPITATPTVVTVTATPPPIPVAERAEPVTATPSSRSSRSSTARETRSTTPSPSTSSSSSSRTSDEPAPGRDVRAEVVRLTNAERAKAGCGPVRTDQALRRAADGHASDMVRHRSFSHTGSDGSTAFQRMRRAGYDGFAAAENIAAGQASPAAVMRSWMSSAGHRANILNCSFNRIGVGYDGGSVGDGYGDGAWVQDFGIS
ncbi:CAP domain-containing protein [Luteipulveratus halotolerans]|uniref:SCP domain-containing protein n=1 Tax=Luteipulveratus halotolerans TaxID=1631356 RepID=A0A0L6CG78_9MICO|nr:CAP domain-containing protein [Luteipulveratus halotolerans]KNX36826.1 hypothetical protein VV01_06160 [Luteipulveratus halotolerans]